VEAAVDAVRPAAIAKDIALRLLLDPQAGPISGDPDRLQQIVWNLVANAVKFTPKSGRVQVTLQRVNSHIEIAVQDNGAGIAPEFLPHIFDRFSQADSGTTRHHGGLGLGLAIVRQLVELHGGTVVAESAGLDLGATFRICLPLAPVKAAQAPEVPRVHPAASTRLAPEELERFSLKGCTVLLVEDDDDARQLLSAVLSSAGAAVECAASAEEGLALVRGGVQPAVVVSDIGMPGQDGYQFIEALRRLEAEGRRPPVPAIALTAYARVEDRMRALSNGFQMHVAKPVEPAELLAVVASVRAWRLETTSG
jgi:CheY-like chemotaxis protein